MNRVNQKAVTIFAEVLSTGRDRLSPGGTPGNAGQSPHDLLLRDEGLHFGRLPAGNTLETAPGNEAAMMRHMTAGKISTCCSEQKTGSGTCHSQQICRLWQVKEQKYKVPQKVI